MEDLEGLKKSCFIIISRFYYPQMPPHMLSKAALQKLSTALYTKQDVPGEEKAILLRRQILVRNKGAAVVWTFLIE